jgi:hypothetical protein
MSDTKTTPKTDSKEVVNFENCKSNVILKVKVIPKPAFVYRTSNDLENLIKFVGSDPKVKIESGKLVMYYGKFVIKDNTVILLSEVGKVSQILNLVEADNLYEIAAQK